MDSFIYHHALYEQLCYEKPSEGTGVYYILGMEKRHIAYLLFFEGIYMAIAGIAGGILAGILFSKLVLLFLLKLIKLPVVMGFSVSGPDCYDSFSFAVILFLLSFKFSPSAE